MATKLKKMQFSSVDVVGRGANQQADICLLKSADPAPVEPETAPTEEEKGLFKRFMSWLREDPAEAEIEPHIEKAADPEPVEADPMETYTAALMKSFDSIREDPDLSVGEKAQWMRKSLEQFNAAVDGLIEEDVEKSLPDYDDIDEI